MSSFSFTPESSVDLSVGQLAMLWKRLGTTETQQSERTQLSVAADGGSNTAVPDLTVEVDSLEEALRRFRQAGIAIEYGPAKEPWGVRRFYVRDLFGRLCLTL